MKSLAILATTILVLGSRPSCCQEPIIPSDVLERLQSISDKFAASAKKRTSLRLTPMRRSDFHSYNFKGLPST